MTEPLTPDEFGAFLNDVRSCRGPSEEEIRADERGKVAEKIATAIEARRCDQGSTFCKDCMCRREDAALARQIGEARA
ncbi:hypothetical protein ACFYUV_20685 [Nonomuraea sp. NPDC003560]|uniref:hypothetical protein n=1 Tax=Nonomuraea sp. NPDC003560 TaxID=3364341 RepID=UPI003699BC78